MTKEHQRAWKPLSPKEVAALFRPAPFRWWIAGGHAIEHFVGQPLRSHGDIDILVLRKDRASLRAFLADWDCWAADPPGQLRPWPPGEGLPLAVNDVWCRGNDQPWRFQVMLDDSEGDLWRSRRCSLVLKPLDELRAEDSADIPFLVPEVQLFYKAKSPRPKDILDLQAALPKLTRQQAEWLRDAIRTAYGPSNEWLNLLEAASAME